MATGKIAVEVGSGKGKVAARSGYSLEDLLRMINGGQVVVVQEHGRLVAVAEVLERPLYKMLRHMKPFDYPPREL